MSEGTEYIFTDEMELTEEDLEKELTEEEKRMFRYFIEYSPQDKSIKIGPMNGSNCINLHGADEVKTFMEFFKDCCRELLEL